MKSVQKKLNFLMLLIAILAAGGNIFAQNNALIINDDGNNGAAKAYIVMHNPSTTDTLTPVYLVVNQSSNLGIVRTDSAGWIISEQEGNFVKWIGAHSGSYVVPFGYAAGTVGANYIPFTFTPGSTVDFTVSTRGTDGYPDNSVLPVEVTNFTSAFLPDGPVSDVIDRWWRVIASANAVASMTFSYRGDENTTDYPIGPFSAQQWWNIGGWQPPLGSTTGGKTPGHVYNATTGSTSISFRLGEPWILSDYEPKTYPIELLSFNALCNDSKVYVTWSTASEVNSGHYTIQRSLNSVDFEDVAIMPAAGNSNSVLFYHYTDNNPLNSDAYYRLKETDVNGSITYSPIVFVKNCSGQNEPTITVSFDPDNRDNLIISIGGGSTGPFTVALYDVLGKQLTQVSKSNVNKVVMNMISYAYGIYLVAVHFPDKTITRKVYFSR